MSVLAIGLAELTERLSDAAPFRLWNVLTDEFWDGRLLPRARRVPLPLVLRTASEEAVPRGAEIVVYCDGPSCPQARLAAGKLVDAGYLEVRAFDGGNEAWTAAGRPFAKTS